MHSNSNVKAAAAPWQQLIIGMPCCHRLQVFSQFHAPSPLSIFVPLSVLLESIATVASSMPQELHFQYPGPNSTLLLT